MSRPTFENATALRARLADYLSAQTGAAVTVESLVKFPAGFSWITYGVRLAGFAQAQNVILRIGPPYGLFAPYSAMPEFQSLSALQTSAVPIPRAFFASDDALILGAPFFLCERVEGGTPLPWGAQEGASLEGAPSAHPAWTTTSPLLVNFTAFPTRLTKTWRSLVTSPISVTGTDSSNR